VMCVSLGGYSLATHVGNAGHTRLSVYALEAMISSLRITPSPAWDRGNGSEARPGVEPSGRGDVTPKPPRNGRNPRHSWRGGGQNGTGPYARASTNITVKANNTRIENSTHVVYTTEYYIAGATVATWTRGLRVPSMVEASVYLDEFQVLTGFLDTVKLMAGGRAFSMNESGLLEKLVFSNLTETRLHNITVYISDYIGFTSGIKSPSNEKPFGGLIFNRTLRMAEIIVKAEPVEPQEWEWGSVRDLGVKVDASIQYHYPDPSTINPEEVKKAITPNPAESLLQYLDLAYIHDKLVSIVESSPMSEYRDAYLWLLAAQIPIAMKNCSQHESAKPLLDALCQACGSDYERVWILGNITRFTLEVATATFLVEWPSLTNETMVETPIVYANITGYPGLWQLYNDTLGIHLAKPVDGKYLVYYDPVENTAFCDWERLLEKVELPTQALKGLRNPIEPRAAGLLIGWLAVVNSNNVFHGEIV